MQKRLIAVATALAVVLIATPTAATASPTPTPSHHPLLANVVDPVPAGFATWDDVFERQDRMTAALAAIRAAAPQSTNASGYSGAVADPTQPALTVYWHGSVPAAVQAAVDTGRQGIPIDLLPAAHTEEQLLSELERLAQDPAFGRIAPEQDGSGLQISWADDSSAGPATRHRAEAASSVPLHFRPARRTIPTSREADGSPYSAGARTDGCTTGFAVNWSGLTRLLFAAHCGANGTSIKTGANVVMGKVINANTSRDTSMIDARGRGWAWDGGVQSTFRKNVIRADLSAKGHMMCSSGSRSGVRCGIQVVDVNVRAPSGAYPMTEAIKTDMTNAWGQGDSGGPLFSVVAGTDSVIAKGIMSSIYTDSLATCTGDGGRVCGYDGLYADVAQTMSYYGATLVTG